MTNKASPNGPSWWQQLSEASKVVLMAAVITGVLGIIGTVIGVLLTDSNSNSSTSSGPSSPAPAPTAPTAPTDTSPAPADTSSAGGGSSVASGFTAAYRNKSVVIQTFQSGCGYEEFVNVDQPSVDPISSNGDSFSFVSIECVNWAFQVGLENQASGSMPEPAAQSQDNPASCLQAIASDPNPGNDAAKTGDSFCIKSADNFLAYVKVVSVDSQGNVTLRLDGWSTN